MKISNHFIHFCRLNPYKTDDYWDISYTINDMNITVGVLKLNIKDGDFFMVFSCPTEHSQNIFFAVAENDFKTASLSLAYCEYYTDGKKSNITEYIPFNQVFFEELKHIYGILLSSTQQMSILQKYPENLEYQGKYYHLILYCLF